MLIFQQERDMPAPAGSALIWIKQVMRQAASLRHLS
jgi:hypothetical protein